MERERLIGARSGGCVQPGLGQAGVSASVGKRGVRGTAAGSQTVQVSATGRVGRQTGFGTKQGS